MSRYFIEVAYKGTHFKGFQTQDNALTIQGELNKKLSILLKQPIETTTSSRTDAGVHAYQNYLHLDFEGSIPSTGIYNLNCMLHADIKINAMFQVEDSHHARFDAMSREYEYQIIQDKNPFLKETAYFYPFPLNMELLNEGAKLLLQETDFTSFAKRHSDVNNHNCQLIKAFWNQDIEGTIRFQVSSNRFLRGMVRALVATSLQLGRGSISLSDFKQIIDAKDCTLADFSAAAHGLFLKKVNYPIHIVPASVGH